MRFLLFLLSASPALVLAASAADHASPKTHPNKMVIEAIVEKTLDLETDLNEIIDQTKAEITKDEKKSALLLSRIQEILTEEGNTPEPELAQRLLEIEHHILEYLKDKDVAAYKLVDEFKKSEAAKSVATPQKEEPASAINEPSEAPGEFEIGFGEEKTASNNDVRGSTADSREASSIKLNAYNAPKAERSTPAVIGSKRTTTITTTTTVTSAPLKNRASNNFARTPLRTEMSKAFASEAEFFQKQATETPLSEEPIRNGDFGTDEPREYATTPIASIGSNATESIPVPNSQKEVGELEEASEAFPSVATSQKKGDAPFAQIGKPTPNPEREYVAATMNWLRGFSDRLRRERSPRKAPLAEAQAVDSPFQSATPQAPTFTLSPTVSFQEPNALEAEGPGGLKKALSWLEQLPLRTN